MQTTDMLVDALNRAEERFLETIAQMNVEQLNTMPTDLIKSVTWLTWHTAKMIDQQLSELAGKEPLYTSQGWGEKFNLALPLDTQDWIHTPTEARKVQVNDKRLLIDYLQAAVAFGREYLTNLDLTTLDEIIDESWESPVTRAVRIISILDDASMHSGQVVYTRRLVLGK
ncbi:DinB family protein [Ligilactobacillus apodemi]|uniref:DinB-like domain-containing protein n=1 Tax=Ligilactobacillus apodemi DSM 16634 = JCM 16172 TaxID=1423724 RepID=A0A0R1TPN6_9LACO|nr:DinB family protein [Ligilactobacillus apodemi]KRL83421.1 hypothetical protein FC32_GL000673 [Ligilactobacillus apodemi DSM 16634 = JCM 16172]MCR1901575.1 DinB family protein [Ligilactobacillus apodemi]